MSPIACQPRNDVMRFHVRKERGFAAEAVSGRGVRDIAISYKLLQCRMKAVVETHVHMMWVRDLHCLIFS